MNLAPNHFSETKRVVAFHLASLEDGDREGADAMRGEEQERNLKLVESFHVGEAGRLGFDKLLDALTEDVIWWAAGPTDRFPWAGTFHGLDGVKQWRAELQSALDYEYFRFVSGLADGDSVVELIDAGGRGSATGKPYASEIVRIWRIRDGKVHQVRSYYDTAAYLEAVTPD